MGYLAKLIDRAIDINVNLENNKIGNYSISPQHGVGLFQFNIYKHDEHIVTIGIYDNRVDVFISTELMPAEIEQIRSTLVKTYPTFKVEVYNKY